MELLQPVITLFSEGGLFMYPIAIVLLTGLIIAAERFVFIGYTATTSRRLWKQVQPLLKTGQLDAVAKIVAHSHSTLGLVFHNGLQRMSNGRRRRRNDLEKTIEDHLVKLLPRLERHTAYLSNFANLAILLGLLGTITGLLVSSGEVSAAAASTAGSHLSVLLAASIKPVAFGLIVAIPLLLVQTVLQTVTTDLVDHIESMCDQFVDTVGVARRQTKKSSPESAAAPELKVVASTREAATV